LKRPDLPDNLVDLLQELCCDVYEKTLQKKRILDNEDGRMGQLKLFLHSFYTPSRTLINRHFAILDRPLPEECFIDINVRRELSQDTFQNFEATAKFPMIKDDVLLYLSLMGAPGRWAFDRDHDFSFYNRFKLIQRVSHKYFENPNAKKRSGEEYEALAFGALCIASHSNGFGGTSLKDFIIETIYHMMDIQNDIVQEKLSISDSFNNVLSSDIIPQSLLDLTIPYYSPGLYGWPQYLAQPTLCFGDLSRPADAAQIDLLGVPLQSSENTATISGECKNHSQSLSNPLFRQILSKIPNDSNVHFIFTHTILKTPYTLDVSTHHNLAAKQLHPICITIKIHQSSNGYDRKDIVSISNPYLLKVEKQKKVALPNSSPNILIVIIARNIETPI